MIASIRRAERQDIEALAALKLATFRETFVDGFAIPYPPEDRAAFEQASYAPAAIAAELADPEHATWVADVDSRLLGYAHGGPCKLPHPDVQPGAGELYQLYVRGETQGMGLGGRLLAAALAHLGATRPGPAWLGVWSGNHRAQAVYAAKGFARVGAYRFPVGNWFDDEFIYRRG